MQSPVNLVAPNSQAVTTKPDFIIDYKFQNDLPVIINKEGIEIVLRFSTFAGGMKIEYGVGQLMSFNLEKITFKFPSEHTINGSRYDGDFVLHMKQITENDDRVFFYNKVENCIIKWIKVHYTNGLRF
jgi:carbonic anhydrase